MRRAFAFLLVSLLLLWPFNAAAQEPPYFVTYAHYLEEPGGRRLFAEKCATCHGNEGRGTDKAPDLIEPAVQAQTDGALFWKIGSGNTRKGMPSFSFLPEAQRWQLVLHLHALRENRK